ncbi:uncharacterized protein LOC142242833 [Haematobia irritans]|uniref:uncharacterized protein LOC142242833 n=1 Tax=Haematobia irritans TaxID=7368 RepID=UPI003F50BAC8
MLYADFFKYISTFDIFFLLETHVLSNKSEKFKQYFGDFEIYWRYATRNSQYGRGIGGYLIGIRKTLRNLGLRYTYRTESGISILNLEIDGIHFNIIPIYMRVPTWKEQLLELDSVLREIDVKNPIIIGDLNVRIGSMQKNIDDVFKETFYAGLEKRRSKDKEVNSRGNEFLNFCYDHGLVIANGMTTGDEMGEFTFVSQVGTSVNDICAISQELLSHIHSFTVITKIWSDHMPITLSMVFKMKNKSSNVNTLLPKLNFNKRTCAEYQNNIRRILAQRQKSNYSFHDIVNIIQEADMAISKRTILFPKKEKWLEEKLDMMKDSRDWWKIVRELRNHEKNGSIPIPAENLKIYFQQLLNQPQISSDIQYAHMYWKDNDLDKEIDILDVTRAVNKAKLNKAAGEDRIPYEYYKNAPNELLQEIANTCNILFEKGELDMLFIKTIIYPILKKGDKTQPSNYRGISFMNCLPKIMMGIVADRLSNWTEKHNKLNEYQAGFRKNYSTADNIFNLSSIIHLNWYRNKKTYAFFVDFRAAFDRVARRAMLFKLHNIGVSTKTVKFIEKIYEKTTFSVWTGEELSDSFDTDTGVKQGCLLSPLLFALYLNDLHDYLGGGINIDSHNIRLLMYADDIVILADEIEVLQGMIQKLENYCMLWNMEVNMEKSKIMIFRRGGRISTKEKWYFQGNEIINTAEYSYLGLTFTPKLSLRKQILERNQLAKNSINATWNCFLSRRNVSLRTKWKIYMAICRSIQSYGSQLWGFTHFDEVDKLALYFLKKILKLPSFTPTYALMLETGIECGHLYTLQSHLKYVTRILYDYGENRLPNLLARKVMVHGIFWKTSMDTLTRENSLEPFTLQLTKQNWVQNTQRLVQSLHTKQFNNSVAKAINSDRFYNKLEPTLGGSYLVEHLSQDEMMWIFKARGDMIALNSNRFQIHTNPKCSMCNTDEIENIQHFLGRCPALKEFRLMFFHKQSLNENELINILNGCVINWKSLACFLKILPQNSSYHYAYKCLWEFTINGFINFTEHVKV